MTHYIYYSNIFEQRHEQRRYGDDGSLHQPEKSYYLRKGGQRYVTDSENPDNRA